MDSTFFSVVPNNSLGKSAVRWLRCNDVHCTPMILSTKEETPSHRLGTYYLETGYGIRPSKVIYDRMHSALTEYDLTKVDLDELFDGFDWLHLSGITPALNKNCADFILRCLRAAKEKGLTVSFDGNFRSTLWSWEEARDYCTQCLPYVDVLSGIEPYHLWKDDEDHSKGDWKDGVPLQPSYEQQDEIFQHFIDRYPNLKCIARHVRYVHSGSENSLKAFMCTRGTPSSPSSSPSTFWTASAAATASLPAHPRLMTTGDAQQAVNFGVAHGALAMTTPGDTSMASLKEVENVMKGAGARVQR